jgi:hypothetical protein
MSGRSCSAASSVFFEAVAIADEKARERGGISSCAGCRSEFGRKFRHCDVGFFFDAGDEKRAMRIELGVPPSAARLGGEASTRPKRLHQSDGERNRYSKMRSSGMTVTGQPRQTGQPAHEDQGNRPSASRITSSRKVNHNLSLSGIPTSQSENLPL